ncbi:hypothetical protein GCM10027051_04990 [Niabella terrae]
MKNHYRYKHIKLLTSLLLLVSSPGNAQQRVDADTLEYIDRNWQRGKKTRLALVSRSGDPLPQGDYQIVERLEVGATGSVFKECNYRLQVGAGGLVEGSLVFQVPKERILKTALFCEGRVQALTSCRNGVKVENFHFDGDTLNLRSYFTDGSLSGLYKVLEGEILYSWAIDATGYWRLDDQINGVTAYSFQGSKILQSREQYKNLPEGIASIKEAFAPSGALKTRTLKYLDGREFVEYYQDGKRENVLQVQKIMTKPAAN